MNEFTQEYQLLNREILLRILSQQKQARSHYYLFGILNGTGTFGSGLLLVLTGGSTSVATIPAMLLTTASCVNNFREGELAQRRIDAIEHILWPVFDHAVLVEMEMNEL